MEPKQARIPAIESLGKRFGMLVVTEVFRGPRRAMARADCDCGQKWEGILNALRSGDTRSCGCQMLKFEDLTGQRFGRRVALHCISRSSKDSSTLWWCRCDCGKESAVQASSLKRGVTKSCGCLSVEVAALRATKHGMTHTPEYISWQAIKGRCLDPKDKDFKNYGARGITLYEPWIKDFSAFYEHIGPRPAEGYTVEREDNDAGYFPGNISWQPRSVQANNNRGNHQITLEGITKTAAQWCEIFNVNYPIVMQRINNSGWEPLRALTTPTERPYRGTRQRNGHQANPANNVIRDATVCGDDQIIRTVEEVFP